MDVGIKAYFYGLIANFLPIKIMSKIFNNIKSKIADVEGDVTKFYGGNNAAGARVRKAMQELKALATDLRKDVLETKTSRTAK